TFTLLADAESVTRNFAAMAYQNIESLDIEAGAVTIAGDLAQAITVGPQGLALFPATRRMPSLTILAGGVAQVTPGGGKVLSADALSIAPGGALDLADNMLATRMPLGSWAGSTYTDITGLIVSGRYNGAW